MKGNTHLLIAGILSFAAAFLHIAVIIGGPDWYRFFGAGEGMAQLAESGSNYPTFVTLAITSVLTIWGLYALSGAGMIVKLPLTKLALILISFVYLARGLAGLVLSLVSQHPAITQNSVTFWIVSSLICLVFGGFYLVGTIKLWLSAA